MKLADKRIIVEALEGHVADLDDFLREARASGVSSEARAAQAEYDAAKALFEGLSASLGRHERTAKQTPLSEDERNAKALAGRELAQAQQYDAIRDEVLRNFTRRATGLTAAQAVEFLNANIEVEQGRDRELSRLSVPVGHS